MQSLKTLLMNQGMTFDVNRLQARVGNKSNLLWTQITYYLSVIWQVKDFVKSRLWKLVKQLATYLSSLDEWYPYDVSMNIIRNSHYPRIHEDCDPSEVLLCFNYKVQHSQVISLPYVSSQGMCWGNVIFILPGWPIQQPVKYPEEPGLKIYNLTTRYNYSLKMQQ